MTEPITTTCPGCGAPASGNFCSRCGTSLGQRTCVHCQADLSPQARFCHRCGRSAEARAGKTGAGPSERNAWWAAGTLCLLLVAGIAYKVTSAAPTPVAPDMANAGAGRGTGANRPAGGGRAPDISGMSPRERFNRLYDRIMQASERGDTDEIERFTPMALGAYQQLDSIDIDAQYHAAMLHTQIGEFPAALALADTIRAEAPAHLFGFIIRGEVAKIQNNPRIRAQAQRDFLAHYRAEMGARRVEYLEHQPVLDEFRNEAESAKGVNSKQ